MRKQDTAYPWGIQHLWERWKWIGKKIGNFQVRLIMTLFYFVVLAPFALLIRLGSDPLGIRASTPRGWRARKDEPINLMEQARRQF